MRNKSLELELEEILKSEEEIVDENINHLMWLIAFNFFCIFVIAFSMYKIGVASIGYWPDMGIYKLVWR